MPGGTLRHTVPRLIFSAPCATHKMRHVIGQLVKDAGRKLNQSHSANHAPAAIPDENKVPQLAHRLTLQPSRTRLAAALADRGASHSFFQSRHESVHELSGYSPDCPA